MNLLKLTNIALLVTLLGCSQSLAQFPSQNQQTAQANTAFSSYSSTQKGVDLRPMMTPVKTQGQRGTCNAFAATSLMEFLIKAKTGKDIDLSEAYNYWAGKKYTLDSKFLKDNYEHDDGLAGFMAVKAYQFGSMLETEWPYEPYNWQQKNDPRCQKVNDLFCTECFTGTMPDNAKLLPYRIEPVFIERTKIADFILTNKKPVIYNITWCLDAVDAKGDFRMPTEQDFSNSGGHVITLVGFNPDTKRFIFKNSHGSSWGNKGYGTIPEDYIIKYCEACGALPQINSQPAEIKDFILKGTMGVSGNLVEKK